MIEYHRIIKITYHKMALRRKLKKIFFIVFFTTLIIKICHDYQILNEVHQKTQAFQDLKYNFSSQVNVITLKKIDEIVSVENSFNLNQRRMSILNPDVGQKVTTQEGRNANNSSEKFPTTNMKDTFIVGKEGKQSESLAVEPSAQDSRVHYNPSFKNKMEEVLRQGLESQKIIGNFTKFRNSTIQWNSKDIPSSNGASKETKINTDPKTTENLQRKTVLTFKEIKNSIRPKNNLTETKDNSNLGTRADSAKRKTLNTKLLRDKMTIIKKVSGKAPSKKPKIYKVSHVVDSSEISLNLTQILRIKNLINNVNEKQIIYNENKFGRLKPNDTVIVIQVHNRLANLRYLAESLSGTRYINSSLVIFSHDFWDDEINRFVRNVTDYRVLQIFFPYSIQLNPVSFPGRDPRDCEWNQQVRHGAQLKNSSCLNSRWKDSYGHYREAAFTQIKHHWWWKIVKIFDNIRALRNFTGQVLFLEEDHYVVPDILHVLRLLERRRDEQFKSHLILGLGNYLKMTGKSANVVERGQWVVNRYNLGFAFDRRAYEVLKSCHKSFCNYDDYNWDWTVAYIAQTCALKDFGILSIKLSRVFHIGSCGTHVREQNCSLSKELGIVRTRIKGIQKTLFPTSLSVLSSFKRATKPKKTNGGWGDFRDRQLCLAIVNGTDVSKVLDNLQFPTIKKGQSAFL